MVGVIAAVLVYDSRQQRPAPGNGRGGSGRPLRASFTATERRSRARGMDRPADTRDGAAIRKAARSVGAHDPAAVRDRAGWGAWAPRPRGGGPAGRPGRRLIQPSRGSTSRRARCKAPQVPAEAGVPSRTAIRAHSPTPGFGLTPGPVNKAEHPDRLPACPAPRAEDRSLSQPNHKTLVPQKTGGALRAHLLCKRGRDELIERDPIPSRLVLRCRPQRYTGPGNLLHWSHPLTIPGMRPRSEAAARRRRRRLRLSHRCRPVSRPPARGSPSASSWTRSRRPRRLPRRCSRGRGCG